MIAAVLSVRWAFEAIARDLDVVAPLDPTSPHAGLGASGPVVYWAVLAGAALLLGAAAFLAVRRRAGGEES
jgi:LPXTG-motif cell wall-anchored protein